MPASNAPTVVDLFCGVGGFSLGAERAGFRSVASVELDPMIHASYRRNFARANAVHGSVSDLDAGAWRAVLGGVRPDVVVGGPPCQGFSTMGRRREDDPRNSLVGEFYRTVSVLGPKAFVMENVPGILDDDHLPILKEAIAALPSRYVVAEPVVIDAADCGAATSRRRVIVVGYDPADCDPLSVAALARGLPRPRRVTVRDAIADLPGPAGTGGRGRKEFEFFAYPDDAVPSAYARKLRRPRAGASRLAREHLARGLVSGLMPTLHSPEVVARYRATPPGSPDRKSRSFRLAWDGQCPTIRAGTAKDKGAFQAVRPIHPDGERVITVREAARITGFPDCHLFAPSTWGSFRMIGNSVPVPLSESIMTVVAAALAAPGAEEIAA